MNPIFSNTLSLMRRNWQLALIVVVAGYAYYKVTSVQREYSRYLDDTKKSYDAELSEVKKIRDVERAEHAQNVKELQESLSVSQKKYEEEVKKLGVESAAKVDKITRQYGKNPSQLAAAFSKTTGVAVVFDEEKK